MSHDEDRWLSGGASRTRLREILVDHRYRDGHSNSDIGARPFISTRTVEYLARDYFDRRRIDFACVSYRNRAAIRVDQVTLETHSCRTV